MDLKFLILSIVLFFCLDSGGQEIFLKGRVVDGSTAAVIPRCHVIENRTGVGAITDRNGEFEMIIDTRGQGISLELSHLSYGSQTAVFDSDFITDELEEGILKILLTLSPKGYDLGAVTIDAEIKPELVYGSERHSIADFELIGQRLVLLTYERRLEKASDLYLVDMDMRPLDSLNMPQDVRARQLKTDYSGQIYLEGDRSLFELNVVNDRISLREVDIALYRSQVEPIVDTISDQVIFSNWTSYFPAFDYLTVQLDDSLIEGIRTIADRHMLELCRAEYKYLNTRDKLKLWRMELETGIEKEVLACVASFDEGLYYEPINAPLFVLNDSIYIFDHHNSWIFIHDSHKNPVDSIPIRYNDPAKVMGNDFTGRLLIDEEESQVFAVFQRPGGRCTLKRVDLTNGTIAKEWDLTYDYPDGLQVHQGVAYYIYRPFESLQKKYLYKEELK